MNSDPMGLRTRLLSKATLILCLLAIFSCSGCATFLGMNRGAMESVDLTPIKKEGYTVGEHGVMQAYPSGGESPSIVLEVNNGKRSFERVPIVPGQPMFVADLVRDAEFYKKVGRVKISILRPNGSMPPVRLDVDFDASGKRVKDGMNYSLRAGDHVVVTADERRFLTQVFSGNVFSKSLK